MDTVRAVLIIAGIIGLFLESIGKSPIGGFRPGWLGVALIAVAVLISVSVK